MKLKNHLVILLLFSMCIIYVIVVKILMRQNSNSNLNNFAEKSVIKLKQSDFQLKLINSLKYRNCTFWNCINIYKCGQFGRRQISIYVYPFEKYLLNSTIQFDLPSKEFYQIVKTVYNSKYFTNNPDKACLFMPSLDLLNLLQYDPLMVSSILHNLKYWNNGENHIIFNMIRDMNFMNFVNFEKSLIFASGFNSLNYRLSYDIALPMYSPLLENGYDLMKENLNNTKMWLVITTQTDIKRSNHIEKLEKLSNENDDLVIFYDCPTKNIRKRCLRKSLTEYNYPNVMMYSHFCIIFNGRRIYSLYRILIESLATNCIPIIVADSTILPFESVLDWKRIALFFSENNFEQDLLNVLKSLSNEFIDNLRYQVSYVFHKYFQNIQKITETTLDILQDRFFPVQSKNYLDWNLSENEKRKHIKNQLYFGKSIKYSNGFTAVILTYNRVKSLFKLINNIAMTPSLSEIVVIWNNQNVSPPNKIFWPVIKQPIKVIQTKANKLSNRFYPYKEIKTESILSLDDDITMLTSDELEFGFQIWKENPDRIVGFPSRTHIYDNVTKSWKYESEWRNEISIILTGAAFIHKYYLYQYTKNLPKFIRNLIDEKMNCEDIAMNFLVANLTKKSPIKIATRKKFKCSQCIKNEMLSESLTHMMQRTKCINEFSSVFQYMPLINSEIRADPVLFKNNVPFKLKKYYNIGSL